VLSSLVCPNSSWDSPEILRAAVDQGRLRPPQRVRTVRGRIEGDRALVKVLRWRRNARRNFAVVSPLARGLIRALTSASNRRRLRMELKTVPIEKPADINFILGQSHFIKTIEDLHEAIVQTVPQMKFGIAFCESSGPALVRWTGNDEELLDLAKKNALALGCGHCFIIFMSSGFPINILNTIKAVPEVCAIYCATGNPVEVIVAETDSGRGILGVIDGMKSKGIETESDIAARKQMLRKFGYKL
jgi:adenosine/AMP kinase